MSENNIPASLPRTFAEAEARGYRRSTPEEIAHSKSLPGGQYFNDSNEPFCYLGPCDDDGLRTICYKSDSGACDDCTETPDGC